MISYVKRLAGPFVEVGATRLPFGFLIFEPSDVFVAVATNEVEVPTNLNFGVDYKVEMNKDQNAVPGGTVVLTAPIKEGRIVVIGSAVEYTQEMQLSNYTRFPPDVINTAMDRIVVQIQQLVERQDRTLTLPATSSATPEEFLRTVFESCDKAVFSAKNAKESETHAADSAAEALASQKAAQLSQEATKRSEDLTRQYEEDANRAYQLSREVVTRAEAVRDDVSVYSGQTATNAAEAKKSEDAARLSQTEAGKSQALAHQSSLNAGASEANASASEKAAGLSETKARQSETVAAEKAEAARQIVIGVEETAASAERIYQQAAGLVPVLDEQARQVAGNTAQAARSANDAAGSAAEANRHLNQTQELSAGVDRNARTAVEKAAEATERAKDVDAALVAVRASAGAALEAAGQAVDARDVSLDAKRDSGANADAAKGFAGQAEASAKAATEAALNAFEKSIETMYAMQRTGKIYGVKIPKYAFNSTVDCIKTHDNAGLVCEPTTAQKVGRDDYLDIPLFQWVNVNYVRDDDGVARPSAIEGMPEYKTSGAVDVGVMHMNFWVKWDSKSDPDYCILQISDTLHEGFVSWYESTKADGTVVPWCIASKYFSGVASDGLPRSQPNLLPMLETSPYGIIEQYQKKGAGYFGGDMARQTYQIIMMLIKYGTKSSQKVYIGCTGPMYNAVGCSVFETNVKRVILSASNAAKIPVGAVVQVGTWTDADIAENEFNIGRNTKNAINISGKPGVFVAGKEVIDEANVALNLEIDHTFTTEKNTRVYFMPWGSGGTDSLPGNSDGTVANDWNYPYRVQGREYSIGTYAVQNTTFLESDGASNFFMKTAPRGLVRSTSWGPNTAELVNVGTITWPNTNSWYVGDIDIFPEYGAFIPTSRGESTAVGYADGFYSNASSESKGAWRQALMGGYLGPGSDAGAVFLVGWSGAWLGGWGCAACD